MKRTISAILILFALSSCKKSFIDLSPVSTVEVDAVYKTDKDYVNAVVDCYSVFQGQYADFWRFSDLRGDDTQNGLIGDLAGLRVDNFTTSTDEGILASSWRNYYNVINRANVVLTRIAGADAAVVTNKDRHTGEAKFLRALAYFDLVRIFGDVPMITSGVTIADSYKSTREKADKIYDEVIIKDLLDAETKLPVKYSGADVGRATRGAAKALLGKVYLTRKDFVKAEAKLQEVTTLGYALLPKFTDLFDYTKDEHHSEYIFDIEYEEGISEGSRFTDQFRVSFQGGGSGVVSELSKLYGFQSDGLDAGCPTQLLFNLFTPDDLRRDITVAKGVTNAAGVFVPLSPTGVFSFTKKYLAPVKVSGDSRANWKVIRYADVLLMYAEALNENGKTADALTYLNMVHTRAGLKALSGLTKDDTRERIYTERRLELYLEGHRWFDLVRTGRALAALQGNGMKPYMTVFPVPQNQIDIINNQQIFPQNAGY